MLTPRLITIELTNKGEVGIDLTNLTKGEALAILEIVKGNMLKHIAKELELQMEIATCKIEEGEQT